jgi:ribonucleoside-diphosphate reductase alpha chain
MGCQFIPGYAEKNMPNRVAAELPENKNTTTAKQLVEKTHQLAQKIAEVKEIKAEAKSGKAKQEIQEIPAVKEAMKHTVSLRDKFADAASRIKTLVGLPVGDTADTSGAMAVMEQFNTQFEHFQDDAPACDVCGAITVRNGTCYKCYNCGNSMGCS